MLLSYQRIPSKLSTLFWVQLRHGPIDPLGEVLIRNPRRQFRIRRTNSAYARLNHFGRDFDFLIRRVFGSRCGVGGQSLDSRHERETQAQRGRRAAAAAEYAAEAVYPEEETGEEESQQVAGARHAGAPIEGVDVWYVTYIIACLVRIRYTSATHNALKMREI